MKKYLIPILGIAVIIAAGLYFIRSSSKSDQAAEASQSAVSGDTVQYKNVDRGFTIQYPKELSVKDFDEGDTTHTITFQDDKTANGFQVFFTPYSGDQITRSRMLKDIPSGDFTDPQEIVINGSIRALAFFSKGDDGEMREVWFLHDGYLFEVTAYKDLDEWLAGIVQTLQFIPAGSAGGQ